MRPLRDAYLFDRVADQDQERAKTKRRARAMRAADTATPDLMQHGSNRHSRDRDEKNTLPLGRGSAYDIARLRKDRPDIHVKVLRGLISANAGMIEAGLRKQHKSTVRTQALRRRKREGKMLLPRIEWSFEWSDYLVDAGLVSDWSTEDPQAIADAIVKLVQSLRNDVP